MIPRFANFSQISKQRRRHSPIEGTNASERFFWQFPPNQRGGENQPLPLASESFNSAACPINPVPLPSLPSAILSTFLPSWTSYRVIFILESSLLSANQRWIRHSCVTSPRESRSNFPLWDVNGTPYRGSFNQRRVYLLLTDDLRTYLLHAFDWMCTLNEKLSLVVLVSVVMMSRDRIWFFMNIFFFSFRSVLGQNNFGSFY